MTENTAVTGHFQKTQGNPGRTAENERVDQSCICREFPEKEECQQDGDSGNSNDLFMSAPHIQVMQLVFESSFIRVQLLPDQIEISLKFRGIAAGKRGKSRIRKGNIDRLPDGCRTACENKDPVSKTDRFGKVMGDKDRCFFSF